MSQVCRDQIVMVGVVQQPTEVSPYMVLEGTRGAGEFRDNVVARNHEGQDVLKVLTIERVRRTAVVKRGPLEGEKAQARSHA